MHICNFEIIPLIFKIRHLLLLHAIQFCSNKIRPKSIGRCLDGEGLETSIIFRNDRCLKFHRRKE